MKTTTLALAALLAATVSAPDPAMAAVFTVTKTADTLDGACTPGDCSLREAIAAANLAPGIDVVELPAGGYALDRVGANEDHDETGDLDVNDPLILVGAGAGSSVIAGNRVDRVFDLRAETEIFGVSIVQGLVSGPGGGILARASTLGYNVVIRRSEISDNQALGSGGEGGGVRSQTPGVLAVIESTLSDNTAEARGGGLHADRLWLIDSTVSGNSGGEAGGGLYYPEGSSPPIWGSTITDNHAVTGGGLYAEPPLFPSSIEPNLRGSIVAGNTARDYPDCFRAYSAGYNVIGIEDGCFPSTLDRAGTATAPLDPKLGLLSTSGGGPTIARAPLPGSPALDLVPAADCTPGDQLGQARSAPCDAGAVEKPLHPACLPGGPVLCLQDGRFRVSASWVGGGPATAVPLTGDTGNFWFFSPQNLELTVKVIDGCALNDRFWVFASGLTDRGVELAVEDLFTGRTWTHSRPTAGTPFPPRLDTSALDSCHPPGAPVGPDVRGALAVDPISAVLVVTKGEDTLDGSCDVDCSLREAVSASNVRLGTEVILLDRRVHALSRAGRNEGGNATGDLDVLGPLVILGSGARHSVIDGNALDRILDSDGPNSRLEIHGVTLRNGDWAGSGGAIHAGYLTLVASHVTGNRAYGGGGVSSWDLVARDTTISDNEATFGGGIESYGFMRLSNVTISGNRALEAGGGINLSAFDQELDGVTITGNSAGQYGGGVFATFETCPSADLGCRTDFVTQRSIVAGNQAPHYRDCLGVAPIPNSYNVFGVGEDGCARGATDVAGTVAAPLDPKLTPLGDHGGPTPTHALLAGSPAIDLGPAAGCLPADQRGKTRPAGAGCDAGAVERLPGCQPDETTLCLGAGDRFKVTARWAVHDQAGDGRPIPQALDTGSFWFFNPANVELTLKVLDGCAVNHRFWVFASGLTDVGVDLTVEDTATGRTWIHHSAAGTMFQPRLDTNALDICDGLNP